MTLAVMSTVAICPPHMLININKAAYQALAGRWHSSGMASTLLLSLVARLLCFDWAVISTGVCVYVSTWHTCRPCGNQLKCLGAEAWQSFTCYTAAR